MGTWNGLNKDNINWKDVHAKKILKAGNVQQYVNFILIPPLLCMVNSMTIYTKDNNQRGWLSSSWVFSQFNNITDRKQARATDPWDTAKKFNSIDGWLAGQAECVLASSERKYNDE